MNTRHYSARVAAERSERTQQLGAAMVMLMPPFFGTAMAADEAAVAEYFRIVGAAARDRGELPVAFQLLIYPMLDDRQVTPSSRTDVPVWPPAGNRFGWKSYFGHQYGGDEIPPYAAPGRAHRPGGPRDGLRRQPNEKVAPYAETGRRACRGQWRFPGCRECEGS